MIDHRSRLGFWLRLPAGDGPIMRTTPLVLAAFFLRRRRLTLGQYLQPTPAHLPVERFVTPEEFAAWQRRGLELGFERVALKADPLTPQGLWRYVTTLKLKGGYAELKSVLAGIRQLPGLFCIENLVIKRVETGGLEMTLDLALYLKEA